MKTQAILTCPLCKATQQTEMPDNSCVPFYKCEKCHQLIKAKDGDCCVFCSYGDQKCNLNFPMEQSQQTQQNELEQQCACGSGKKAGACCKSQQSCSCGSGNPTGECCYKSQ